MPFGFGPFGRRPFGRIIDLPLTATIAAAANAAVIFTAEIIPATGTPIYVATEQYNTLPTDSRSSTSFNGLLEEAPTFNRSIWDGNGFGRMSTGTGKLGINNASGEFDGLIAAPLGSARVILKMGWRGISYDRFITLHDGVVQRAGVTEDMLVIEYKDDNKRLEVPAQPSVYGGTGGIDGDANVKGKHKPVMLGAPPNVSAPLIDAVKLIFQYHDGPSGPVTKVEDRGLVLTVNATADYATYAALEGATITPGRWASCVAAGCVRLGAKPDGRVTVFAQGAVNNGLVAGSVAGTVLTDTASLIHYLLTISPANIVVDTGSILKVKTAQPAPIGCWIGPDDNTTLRQVIDDLTDGILGRAGFRRDRSFELGIVALPTATPTASYTKDDWLVPLKVLSLPAIADPPPHRIRLPYSLNWTIDPDLDSTVDAGTQTLRKDPYSIATSDDAVTSAAILALYPDAPDPDVGKAWFVNSADAIAECNRRLVFLGGGPRSMFMWSLPTIGLSDDIGGTIEITDDRFGLSGGRNLVLMEIDDKLDEQQVDQVGFG